MGHKNETKKISGITLLVLLSTKVFALDSACTPVLTASEARMKQEAWHSITIINGDMRMENIKVDGKFFRQFGGAWTQSPINFDEAEAAMLAQIRSDEVKLSQCKSVGSEVVDGVAVNIVSYRIEMPGAPAADSTLYLGKADNLPYKQEGNSVLVRYSYQDVVAPNL